MLIPVLFSCKRLRETSFLPFELSLTFITAPVYGGLTRTRSDELSRVDWYHQESSEGVPSWLPGSRVSFFTALAVVRTALGDKTLARHHPNVLEGTQIN